MNLEIHNNIININSPIISFDDTEELINALKNLSSNYKEIELNINNSFALPSRIIGELEFLHSKAININIKVKDPILFELLNDLGLNRKFNIKKV